jgi:hypothetical protein
MHILRIFNYYFYSYCDYSQIRLMISAGILTSLQHPRSFVAPWFWEVAFHSRWHCPLPLAPAEGLVLVNSAFAWNQSRPIPNSNRHHMDLAMSPYSLMEEPTRFQNNRQNNGYDDDYYTLLTATEYQESEKFLQQIIYTHMIRDWREKEIFYPFNQQQTSSSLSSSSTTATIDDTTTSSSSYASLITAYQKYLDHFTWSSTTYNTFQQLYTNILETRQQRFLENNHYQQRYQQIHQQVADMEQQLLTYQQALHDYQQQHALIEQEITQCKLKIKRINNNSPNDEHNELQQLEKLLQHWKIQMKKTIKSAPKLPYFPHRLFLPNALTSQLAVQYQLLPGEKLHEILSILASRIAKLVSKKDSNQDDYYSIEGLVQMIEKDLEEIGKGVDLHGLLPNDLILQSKVVSEAIYQRNRLLLWHHHYKQEIHPNII